MIKSHFLSLPNDMEIVNLKISAVIQKATRSKDWR